VHVRDVARANVLALASPEPVPGTFNVATGDPRTVLDLAEALSAAGGGPPPSVVGGHRIGDVRHVFAATDRAAAVLGFRAEIDFDSGMAELAGVGSQAAVVSPVHER
jgi:dTDP-L-rhamnose 4-epimerase